MRVTDIHRQRVGSINHVSGRIGGVIVRSRLPDQGGGSIIPTIYLQYRRSRRSLIVQPRHGGLQGRTGIKFFLQQIIEPLRIVHEESYPIMCFSGHLFGTDEAKLSFYFIKAPVSFARVQEVNAQPWDDMPSVALFLPVEGKGIKVIAPEIHHRIDLVLNAFSEPALHVLVNGMIGVPTAGGIAACIPVFTHGAGADFYPRLQLFYFPIDISENFRQIIPPPLFQAPSPAPLVVVIAVGESAGMFGIAQKVEVHTIYVVACHHLTHQAHQIFFGFRVSSVEIPLPSVRHTNVAVRLGDGACPQVIHMFAVSQRQRHHPGMTLHTALVALFDGESQRVIAWVTVLFSGKHGIHRFDV